MQFHLGFTIKCSVHSVSMESGDIRIPVWFHCFLLKGLQCYTKRVHVSHPMSKILLKMQPCKHLFTHWTSPICPLTHQASFVASIVFHAHIHVSTKWIFKIIARAESSTRPVWRFRLKRKSAAVSALIVFSCDKKAYFVFTYMPNLVGHLCACLILNM